MCALLGVLVVAEPPPTGAPMTLTLLIPESDRTLDLEAFLDERARETWEVGDSGARFEVVIAWPDDRRLVVRVHEGERELASREIEVADPGATKLTVWLVVKSTINRALREGPRVAATVAEPEVDVRVPVAAKPARATWSVGALVLASVGRLELFRFGPSAVAWLNPWRGLVVTLEAGYRISPGVNVAGRAADLTIHYVPVTASAGWQLNPIWNTGLFATADVKVPVYDTGSKLAAGLDVGAHVQALLPLSDRARLVGRAFAAWRASRARFVVDEGSITEAQAFGGVAVGALWR